MHNPATTNFMTQRSRRVRNSNLDFPNKLTLVVMLRISFLAWAWGTSFLAVAATPSTATELTVGRAAKVGVNPETLNQAASLIREAVAEDKIPGAVILVVKEGEIILHEAFGIEICNAPGRCRPTHCFAWLRTAKRSRQPESCYWLKMGNWTWTNRLARI